MNKKEKEQLKLNNLLQECIDEQKAIGLRPADNIEIYIGKDPTTNTRCPKTSDGYSVAFDESKRRVVLIKRKCFDVYSTMNLKTLIHHELIHLNLKDDGSMIRHKKDWKLFTKIANEIHKAYGINPLESFSLSCYDESDGSIRYNTIAECYRCGARSFGFLDETKNYNFNNPCPFCGGKLIYKKASH